MEKISQIKTDAIFREIQGYGYNASKCIILYWNKDIKWNWIAIYYGIRNSRKKQYFPIWNTSNNCQRSLMIGFGFNFIEIVYHRKKPFNQKRWLPFRNKRALWKLYQLFI